MLKIIFAASIAFLLAGCASLTSENKQWIGFKTSCSNLSIPAACIAENSKGKWQFITPKKVLIDNDISYLKITCKSQFTAKHSVEAIPIPKLIFAGNILAGGIFGAAVDIASSRGFQYQDDIEIINPFCNKP